MLRHLDFKIEKGLITTILGYSGAGKSTLMKHILGILAPDQGRLNVLGQDLSALSSYELRNFRQNFGMLFQYAALFDSMTAYDNIAFPLREFTSQSEKDMRRHILSLAQSVGLDEKALQRLPSELSGGMKKRVGLARALVLTPKIMLYDEPTTGLDPLTTHLVNELMVKTHREHQDLSTVIISHDLKASFKISDRIAFLHQGQVLAYDTPEKLMETQEPIIRQFIDYVFD